MLAMIDRLFRNHPRSVGETYLQHMEHASSFGARMIFAGFACMIHGLFPWLFVKTGSTTVRALYNDMLINRRRADSPAEAELGAYI
jgi:hypothetical protein